MPGIRLSGNIGQVVITDGRFDNLDLAVVIDGAVDVSIERTVVTNADGAFKVSCEGDVFGSNNVYLREVAPDSVINSPAVNTNLRALDHSVNTRLAAAIRRASNGDVGD